MTNTEDSEEDSFKKVVVYRKIRGIVVLPGIDVHFYIAFLNDHCSALAPIREELHRRSMHFSSVSLSGHSSSSWMQHTLQLLVSITLSLQKVRNFAHFWGIFKYRIHHEILNLFEYSLFACRHRLIKYAPAVSDVVYRHLEVVVGALKKIHIFTLRT